MITADHPPKDKHRLCSGSSQIPPPGEMPRLGPQRGTGTPANGPSTDPTPPFQHTPSPPTGGCQRPGPQAQWTRRVTATASAPHKTQVGLRAPSSLNDQDYTQFQGPTCTLSRSLSNCWTTDLTGTEEAMLHWPNLGSSEVCKAKPKESMWQASRMSDSRCSLCPSLLPCREKHRSF